MYGVMFKNDIYDMVAYVCGLLDDKYKQESERLILGTIAQETHMATFPDLTKYAGMGLCQIDKIAFDDVKTRTRQSRKELMKKAWDIDLDLVEWEHLRYNPLLSIIFCRLFYLLVPEKIPLSLEEQARYWKKYYNTKLGKGTEYEYITNYKKFVV